MMFKAYVNEVCHAAITGTTQTKTSYSYDIGVDGTVTFEFDAFQLSLPCGTNLVSYQLDIVNADDAPISWQKNYSSGGTTYTLFSPNYTVTVNNKIQLTFLVQKTYSNFGHY
jgi:hypothetical protein